MSDPLLNLAFEWIESRQIETKAKKPIGKIVHRFQWILLSPFTEELEYVLHSRDIRAKHVEPSRKPVNPSSERV
ncbi:MAG: hypothetical protein WBH85_14395, partial [Thermoanaerobaculia bacterium]